MNQSLLPYSVIFGDSIIKISKIAIDGNPLPDVYINSDEMIANVSALRGGQWMEAEISVDVSVPFTELKSRRDISGAPRLLLRAQCRQTNVRQSTIVPIDSDRVSASLTLPKDQYSGSASVDAFIVANLKIDGAVTPNRILSEAKPWTVRFTEPTIQEIAQRKSGGKKYAQKALVDPKWVDFTNPPPTLSFLLDVKEEPFYLQLHGPEPSLYLNEGIDGYRRLLNPAAGRPEIEKAYRNGELLDIAGHVLQAMFNAGLASLDKGSDEQEPYLPEDWRKDVVAGLCRYMYPKSSLLDAYTSLYESKEDDTGEDIKSVQEALQVGVQRMLGRGKAIAASLSKIDRRLQ